jgi:hypothetical protein
MAPENLSSASTPFSYKDTSERPLSGGGVGEIQKSLLFAFTKSNGVRNKDNEGEFAIVNELINKATGAGFDKLVGESRKQGFFEGAGKGIRVFDQEDADDKKAPVWEGGKNQEIENLLKNDMVAMMRFEGKNIQTDYGGEKRRVEVLADEKKKEGEKSYHTTGVLRQMDKGIYGERAEHGAKEAVNPLSNMPDWAEDILKTAAQDYNVAQGDLNKETDQSLKSVHKKAMKENLQILHGAQELYRLDVKESINDGKKETRPWTRSKGDVLRKGFGSIPGIDGMNFLTMKGVEKNFGRSEEQKNKESNAMDTVKRVRAIKNFLKGREKLTEAEKNLRQEIEDLKGLEIENQGRLKDAIKTQETKNKINELIVENLTRQLAQSEKITQLENQAFQKRVDWVRSMENKSPAEKMAAVDLTLGDSAAGKESSIGWDKRKLEFDSEFISEGEKLNRTHSIERREFDIGRTRKRFDTSSKFREEFENMQNSMASDMEKVRSSFKIGQEVGVFPTEELKVTRGKAQEKSRVLTAELVSGISLSQGEGKEEGSTKEEGSGQGVTKGESGKFKIGTISLEDRAKKEEQRAQADKKIENIDEILKARSHSGFKPEMFLREKPMKDERNSSIGLEFSSFREQMESTKEGLEGHMNSMLQDPPKEPPRASFFQPRDVENYLSPNSIQFKELGLKLDTLIKSSKELGNTGDISKLEGFKRDLNQIVSSDDENDSKKSKIKELASGSRGGKLITELNKDLQKNTFSEAINNFNESRNKFNDAMASTDFSNQEEWRENIIKSLEETIKAAGEMSSGEDNGLISKLKDLQKRIQNQTALDLKLELAQDANFSVKQAYEKMILSIKNDVDFMFAQITDGTDDFNLNAKFTAKILEKSSRNLRNAGMEFAAELARTKDPRFSENQKRQVRFEEATGTLKIQRDLEKASMSSSPNAIDKQLELTRQYFERGIMSAGVKVDEREVDNKRITIGTQSATFEDIVRGDFLDLADAIKKATNDIEGFADMTEKQKLDALTKTQGARVEDIRDGDGEVKKFTIEERTPENVSMSDRFRYEELGKTAFKEKLRGQRHEILSAGAERDLGFESGSIHRVVEANLRLAESQKELNKQLGQGTLFADQLNVRIAEANRSIANFGETLANASFDGVQTGFEKAFDTLTNIETRVDLAEKGINVGEMAALEFADAFLGSVRDAMVKNMSEKLTAAVMTPWANSEDPSQLVAKADMQIKKNSKTPDPAEIQADSVIVNANTVKVPTAANTSLPPSSTPPPPPQQGIIQQLNGTIGQVSTALNTLITSIASAANSIAAGVAQLASGAGDLASGLGAGIGNVAAGFGTGVGAILSPFTPFPGPTYVAANSGGSVGFSSFANGGRMSGAQKMSQGINMRDTVPAMLTPGEFVIRKESVDKLGSGFLSHLNEKGEIPQTSGFARGGQVQNQNVLKTITSTGANMAAMTAGAKLGADASGALDNLKKKDKPPEKPRLTKTNYRDIGASFQADFTGLSIDIPREGDSDLKLSSRGMRNDPVQEKMKQYFRDLHDYNVNKKNEAADEKFQKRMSIINSAVQIVAAKMVSDLVVPVVEAVGGGIQAVRNKYDEFKANKYLKSEGIQYNKGSGNYGIKGGGQPNQSQLAILDDLNTGHSSVQETFQRDGTFKREVISGQSRPLSSVGRESRLLTNKNTKYNNPYIFGRTPGEIARNKEFQGAYDNFTTNDMPIVGEGGIQENQTREFQNWAKNKLTTPQRRAILHTPFNSGIQSKRNWKPEFNKNWKTGWGANEGFNFGRKKWISSNSGGIIPSQNSNTRDATETFFQHTEQKENTYGQDISEEISPTINEIEQKINKDEGRSVRLPQLLRSSKAENFQSPEIQGRAEGGAIEGFKLPAIQGRAEGGAIEGFKLPAIQGKAEGGAIEGFKLPAIQGKAEGGAIENIESWMSRNIKSSQSNSLPANERKNINTQAQSTREATELFFEKEKETIKENTYGQDISEEITPTIRDIDKGVQESQISKNTFANIPKFQENKSTGERRARNSENEESNGLDLRSILSRFKGGQADNSQNTTNNIGGAISKFNGGAIDKRNSVSSITNNATGGAISKFNGGAIDRSISKNIASSRLSEEGDSSDSLINNSTLNEISSSGSKIDEKLLRKITEAKEYKRGGNIEGVSGDNNIIKAEGGEFIINKKSVEKINQDTPGLLEDLNSQRYSKNVLKGYKSGGYVGDFDQPKDSRVAREDKNPLLDNEIKSGSELTQEKDTSQNVENNENVTNNISININMDNQGNAEADVTNESAQENAANLAKKIKDAVMQAIREEKRNGGELS